MRILKTTNKTQEGYNRKKHEKYEIYGLVFRPYTYDFETTTINL